MSEIDSDADLFLDGILVTRGEWDMRTSKRAGLIDIINRTANSEWTHDRRRKPTWRERLARLFGFNRP